MNEKKKGAEKINETISGLYIEFLKPDLKKIIVLLIIISPFVFALLHFLPLPEQFDLLNTYFSGYIDIVKFPFFPMAFFLPVILVFYIEFLFWYVISCLVVLGWNKVFELFGEKKKQYEKFAVVSLITLFIFIPIILQAIIIIENKTRPNISIEINTRPNISIDEVTIPPFYRLQELKVHNYFVSRARYKLPDVTACINDIEGNLKLGLFVHYMTEDGQTDDVIEVKPETELKVYLKIYGAGEVQPKELFIWNNIPKYDNAKLLESLKQDFGIDWVKDALVEKIDNDRTIIVSGEKNHLFLSLNNEKTKVNLTTDDGRTYELFVISRPVSTKIAGAWITTNELHIYKPIEKEKFDEIVLFKSIGRNNYTYCHNATDEEVLASEKIKISK